MRAEGENRNNEVLGRMLKPREGVRYRSKGLNTIIKGSSHRRQKASDRREENACKRFIWRTVKQREYRREELMQDIYIGDRGASVGRYRREENP